jgi:NhaA family Na+:H+ antiporter
MINAIRKFLRLESAGGIILFMAAVLAMAAENSAAREWYDALLNTPVAIRIGTFEIAKPLLLWINDGLMAVFFFLIGLELKREVLQGELSNPSQIVLPVAAAAGGLFLPALIYIALNWEDAMALRGWAIPAATDIAFAMGVLSLLGTRVPHALKLFLLTLAITDDLGAIVIIAVFYTADLSLISLIIAGGAIAVLYIFNRRGVRSLVPYLLVGIVMWVAVLKSGVHATLAGIVLALFIPLRVKVDKQKSPLELLEHDLHPAVAFAILPLFAFANTGVSLDGVTFSSLLEPIPLGITAGLFLGKQLGVMGAAWMVIKLGWARLPSGTRWRDLYGVAVLCGIGFTMSLFISSLAFGQGSTGFVADDRLGILCGSTLSALLGYAVLRLTLGDATQTGYPKT